MARHYFKTLFFTAVAAVGCVYIPVLIYNGIVAKQLLIIWVAIISLEFVRGAPVIGAVLIGVFRDPKRDETSTLLFGAADPYNTEEERKTLLSSNPALLSINGSEDDTEGLPYPDGPPA